MQISVFDGHVRIEETFLLTVYTSLKGRSIIVNNRRQVFQMCKLLHHVGNYFKLKFIKADKLLELQEFWSQIVFN